MSKEMITTYLTPEQTEKLAELSKRTRVPKAVYMREAIDLVLAKYRDAPAFGKTLAEVFAEEDM